MTTAHQGHRHTDGLATDVQRFGLLSAATVVSRYAAIVNRAVDTGAPPASPPGRAEAATAETDPDWLVVGVPRLAEATLRLLDLATTLAEQASSAGPRTAAERADLPSTTPGACTEVSVWLHNPTPDVAVVQLHTTCLVSGGGAVLPSGAVTCDPADGVEVAGGGSREVRVRVMVPTEQPTGRYHGLLVGSPSREPLPVLVEVTAVHGEGW